MSKRANALADRIEQGAQALAAFVENLSDAEWEMTLPTEERTVGVLVHHVASAYPIEVDLAQSIAAGQAITGVTWTVIAQMNAQHALQHGAARKAETLALLHQNSKAAAERVRQFTDAQLDAASVISLYADAPLTAQFFLEDHALRHSFHHLANIRSALRDK